MSHNTRPTCKRERRTSAHSMLTACALWLASAAALAGPAGQPAYDMLPNPGYKNLGGVIDRSVPHAAPAADANANVPQFNRLADHNAFTPLPEVAADADGGPSLYTVLERAPAPPTQVRPVTYRAPNRSRPSIQPAQTNKRFCTVTEVSRAAPTEACR